MVRSLIVLGAVAAVALPTHGDAQQGFNLRSASPIEFIRPDSLTVRAIPRSMASSDYYRNEGAIVGFIAGGLASYLLFRASRGQQCYRQCGGGSTIAVGVVLGSVVGGTLGGVIGSRMKKTRDRSRWR